MLSRPEIWGLIAQDAMRLSTEAQTRIANGRYESRAELEAAIEKEAHRPNVRLDASNQRFDEIDRRFHLR